MTTYYVRKDGNDTTGDGGTGNPWLTVDKGLKTMGNNDTLKIGAGTYIENSGSGYLNIPFKAAAFVESESGVASDVILTSPTVAGGGSSTFNVLCSAQNITLRNVTIQSSDTAKAAAIHGSSSGMTFIGVVFVGAGNATARADYICQPSGAISNITFTNCTFSDDGVACDGVRIVTLSAVNTMTGLTLTNCSITSKRNCLRLGDGNNNRVNNVTISGGTFTSSNAGELAYLNGITNLAVTNLTTHGNTDGFVVYKASGVTISGGNYASVGGHALSLGSDESLIGAVTGAVDGATILSTTGHGLLLGYGASNVGVTNCTITGGDHGLVIKHNDGAAVSNCAIIGGTSTGLYFKAATNAAITRSSINCNAGYTVQLGVGDASTKSAGCDVTYCRINCSGSAAVFNWSGTSGDSGGGICDYNTYAPYGSGSFGSVYGTSGIISLAALRTAWDTYDVPTNDDNSRLAGNQILHLGSGRGLGSIGGHRLRVIG